MVLYIAASDLVPARHEETRTWRSLAQLAKIFADIGVMALFLLLE